MAIRAPGSIPRTPFHVDIVIGNDRRIMGENLKKDLFNSPLREQSRIAFATLDRPASITSARTYKSLALLALGDY